MLFQVLLILCDIEESEQRLRELNQICVFSGWSVILAYSLEEAAEYLELYKIYEHKSADLLHGIEPSSSKNSAGLGSSKNKGSPYSISCHMYFYLLFQYNSIKD